MSYKIDSEMWKSISLIDCDIDKVFIDSNIQKNSKFTSIVQQFTKLKEVLDDFVNNCEDCCTVTDEECFLQKLVCSMNKALNHIIPLSPLLFSDLFSDYFKVILLELNRVHNQVLEAKKLCYNITQEKCDLLGNKAMGVKVLFLSRYEFSEDYFAEDAAKLPTIVIGDHLHHKMWKRSDCLMPVIDFNKELSWFTLTVDWLMESKETKKQKVCANCKFQIGRTEDFALFDSCRHFVCIRCAYTMSAAMNVICLNCKLVVRKWTTKQVMYNTGEADQVFAVEKDHQHLTIISPSLNNLLFILGVFSILFYLLAYINGFYDQNDVQVKFYEISNSIEEKFHTLFNS